MVNTWENVESENLLGVVINHNLSWESHINGVVSNINRKLALLRRIKGYLPLATRKIFSNSHILPYIDYCSLVWWDSPHVYNILKAQKQVVRTTLDVKGKSIRDPENRSHLMFSKLNWMNIFNRVKFRKATMVYKCLNNLAPQNMCNMFNYVTNSRNTRQSAQKDLEVQPGTHKVLFENSFRYSAVNEWNNIKPYILKKQKTSNLISVTVLV